MTQSQIRDKNGNLIKKKRSHSKISNNPYKNIKSKFKNHVDFCTNSEAKNKNEDIKLVSDSKKFSHNLSLVKEKIKRKRKRFFTEGDNSYLSPDLYQSSKIKN